MPGCCDGCTCECPPNNFKELLDHPSVVRELNRFRSLGGTVMVSGNWVILAFKGMPEDVAEAFAQRIRDLDKDNFLKVEIQV